MSAIIKRRISGVLVIIMFIFYYLSTDPDTKLFQNLSFGSGLILTIQIFVMAMGAILMVEFLPDFFIDHIYGKEYETRKHATVTSQGAGLTLIAKSIRIFAYSIIIAASIISYNIN